MGMQRVGHSLANEQQQHNHNRHFALFLALTLVCRWTSHPLLLTPAHVTLSLLVFLVRLPASPQRHFSCSPRDSKNLKCWSQEHVISVIQGPQWGNYFRSYPIWQLKILVKIQGIQWNYLTAQGPADGATGKESIPSAPSLSPQDNRYHSAESSYWKTLLHTHSIASNNRSPELQESSWWFIGLQAKFFYQRQSAFVCQFKILLRTWNL